MSQPLQTVKPGQSRHSTVTAKSLGLLTDPTTLVLAIRSSDGSVLTPSVTRDSIGTFHADYVIPITAKDGVWVRRWVANGASPSSVALDEVKFIVPKLDY